MGLYAELHQAYRESPATELPATNQEEIDTFVVMASTIAGENLTEFLTNGHCRIPKKRFVPAWTP